MIAKCHNCGGFVSINPENRMIDFYGCKCPMLNKERTKFVIVRPFKAIAALCWSVLFAVWYVILKISW